MSTIQTRTLLRAVRTISKSHRAASIRFLATAPENDSNPATAAAATTGKKSLSPNPLPSPAPIFPAPANPFNPEPAAKRTANDYSDTTKKLVRGIARIMGYNSRQSTAIRETRRMMTGIVQAVIRDRYFWYDQCRLPPSYQTFFQIHLLYVLILMPRFRALPAHPPKQSHQIPEPPTPSPPHHQNDNKPDSSPISILTKPSYDAYQAELLDHFFELAESQMRIVLGQGERERVIQKYMREMAEQWKGANVGLEYVIGLSMSEDPSERSRADEELASWIWRNMFQGKGLTAKPLPGAPILKPDEDSIAAYDLDLAEQLEKVVRFVRREMARLDRVTDADVLSGDIGDWGSPSDHGSNVRH